MGLSQSSQNKNGSKEDKSIANNSNNELTTTHERINKDNKILGKNLEKSHNMTTYENSSNSESSEGYKLSDGYRYITSNSSTSVTASYYTSTQTSTTTNKSSSTYQSTIEGHQQDVYGLFPGKRTTLPAIMPSHDDISVWSILKQCIGKDLSKIAMPIVFNEPLSFLQRLTEYMEYAFLLEQADATDNPVERMEFIAAFAVSGCATNWERLGKPFNPLLGETYELDMPEAGYSMVCEQVSHHPPISAFHAESKLYKFHGSIHPKSKFWGKALDVTPIGVISLYLKNHNECYTWTNPNCTIHNIIMGKLWIEHAPLFAEALSEKAISLNLTVESDIVSPMCEIQLLGTLDIKNHTNGYSCSVNFRPAGMFGKEVNRVDGFILDQRNTKVRALYGHWNLALYSTTPKNYESSLSKSVTDKMLRRRSSSLSKKAYSYQTLYAEGAMPENDTSPPPTIEHLKYAKFVLDLPQSKLLWHYRPKPANSKQMFNFSLFSMILNELPPDASKFPCTDSRFRPDMREYENGKVDLSSKLKNALEEKQRTVAKAVKSMSASQLNALRIDPNDHSTKLQSLDKLRSCDIVKGPLWFASGPNPNFKRDSDNIDWQFNDAYWQRNYGQCPQIFELPS